MTVTTTPVFDATGSNIASLPAGQHAGYVTGSDGIPWTAADWARDPGAVRIDQSPVNTALDETADVLDLERGAATLADLAGWAKAALASFRAATRPGQRSPAVYASRSNPGYSIHDVADALIAGGVTSGVGLWIADWNNDEAQAAAEVAAGDTGPFPVIGRQYASAGPYDKSVFSAAWLREVSVTPDAQPAKPPPPPGQWDDPAAWTWTEAFAGGVGLDGKLHLFELQGDRWVKVT